MSRRRAGFTLVELIVTVLILLVLLALLLPSVRTSREAARRTQCRNNLKSMGLALHNYHDHRNVFPSSSTSQPGQGLWNWPASGPTDPSVRLHSHFVMLLPYVDQAHIYNIVEFGVSALAPENRRVATHVVPTYRCPSYAGPSFSAHEFYTTTLGGQFAIGNYAAMGATSIAALRDGGEPEGVLYPGSAIRLEDIADGTSNTFFIAETKEPVAAAWIDGSTAAVASRGLPAINATNGTLGPSSLNHSPYLPNEALPHSIGQEFGPSSLHAGGVHHLMADGTVRFISNNISPKLYDALVTRDGGETIGEY